MDGVGLALMGAALALLGFILYWANTAALDASRVPLLRSLLYGVTLLIGSFGMPLLGALLFPPESLDVPAVGSAELIVGLAVVLGAAAFSAAVIGSGGVRIRLARLLGPAYDPNSPVHLAALVLSSALLSYTVISLIAGGGVAGLAELISESGVPVGETLFQNVLWVLAALLGIGLFLRRSPAQALNRLGLRRPGAGDVLIGAGAGLALYGLVIAGGLIWALIASPEQISEQSAVSAALAQSVTGIPDALLLSLPVAIGEEVFFRGALQPVLGLGPTALFFTALHAQYGLTPALAVLLAVGLGLGWLAKRRGTVTAIIAHFVYNFVQLVLALMAASLLPAGGS